MTKTIIKEVCIMILLLIAIVLIFGVLFYDYIPLSKTIPNTVAYTKPEGIENELKEAAIEETGPINVVYQIDESQLSSYERSKSYNPGKYNPFGTVTAEVTDNTNTNGTSSSSGTGSSSSNSTGSYFNNAGTK